MNFTKSIEIHEKAKGIIPGGVNSPVRAFKSVKGSPVYIARAKGSRLYDIDGNAYIEYVNSWGPLILGHAHEQVVEAIKKAAESGTSYGAPTEQEYAMAELICSVVPSIEMVRMVNSGTEATMSALRLARGYTGRDLVVKFEGCYHGHADSFLIKAGSGAATLGLPDSPGVTAGTAKDTITIKFNDTEALKALFAEQGQKIAAVIIEPVVGNMGVVIPRLGFLESLREITKHYGALLIFDEVMTGFRLSIGGAQALYGISPDITTFGKVIGGGLPVGGYGASKEIMERMAPAGPIYQAGTLSGNPLAMAAGIATLKILKDNPGLYDDLEKKGAVIEQGLKANLKEAGIKGLVNRVGSMFTLFFTELDEVNNFDDALKSNTEFYARYFKASLESGIYLAPSQYEAAFISTAISNEDIEKTLEASRKAMKLLKETE